MANVMFDNPPILNGAEEAQLQQLYAYLSTMSTKLNEALMSITIEQMTPEARTEIREGSAQQRTQQEKTLKSLIVKTAEIVRTEMDEIRTTLNGQVQALSEQFGSFEQDMTATITATANGILQDYHFEERIQGLEATDAAGFIRKINQYVFCGLVDSVNGKYGIAIGENVTAADGTMNAAGRKATFTMDELAFYEGDTKVAYMSNNTFNITNGEIKKTLKMGNHTWMKLSDGSLALLAGS